MIARDSFCTTLFLEMSKAALCLIDELIGAVNIKNTPNAIISAICIYPIYGSAPIELKQGESWEYTSTGFKYNCNWCVINAKTKKIISPSSDVCSYSKLHLLKPSINNKSLTIQFPNKQYTISMDKISNTNEDEKTSENENINIALSKYLGIEAELKSLNKPDIKKKSKVDWFPFLLMFEESITALNKFINNGIYYDYHRFRPNILIKGWNAFEEDNIKYIQFKGDNNYIFKFDANELNQFCCNCTRIDPLTGKIDENDNGQPTKAIKEFRDSKFGISLNLINDTDLVKGTFCLNQVVVPITEL
eukprot:39039_1